MTVLCACTEKSALKLSDVQVDIIKDKEKTGSQLLQQGEKEGQEVVSTSLYYTFVIKNEGKKTLGKISKTKNLTVKLEPNKKLVAVSKEVRGFNIFNPKEYNESGLGYGSSFVGVLKPSDEGKYILYYELGISEETKEVLLVPSKEKIEKLKNNALDATLIVFLDNKEITRFDLSQKNKEN